MKKRLIIGIICIAIATALLLHIGSYICTGVLIGNAALRYQGTEVTLTAEESALMREIFRFKFYNRGIGGCPFDENTSISFENTVFAIALDDCYSAKDMRNNLFIEFNREEFQEIIAVYEKYFGDTMID